MNTQTQQNNDPTIATKNPFTVFKMIQIFDKIEKGAHAEHLAVLSEELQKMHPTDESEVFFSTDYSVDENSVGVSIYVSNPIATEKAKPMPFGKLMTEYLLRSDVTELSNTAQCLNLIERADGNEYDVDFIPVFYTEEIDKHDINIRITKK